MSGIHTLDDLKDRCVIDEITGCWLFGGHCAIDGNGATMWFPPLGIRTTVGQVIGYFMTGKRPAPGVIWHRTCESNSCCNPRHRKAGTRQTQMLQAKITRSPEERARITRSLRSKSHLSEADVNDIRTSTDKLTACAARYNIDQSYVSAIRRGKSRKPLVQGASIFNLGSTL